MRLTFHGGVLLAAISAATAEASTLTESRNMLQEVELAQTKVFSELDSELQKEGEKKKKAPSGIMAGLGQMAGGVAKQANKAAKAN